MSVLEDMVQEIKQEISQDITLEDIKDRSHEYVDNYVPVYNNRIIDEWKDMPGDYDDRGAAELGVSEDTSIVRLMSLDLYLYYSDLFTEALEEVESELEEAE